MPIGDAKKKRKRDREGDRRWGRSRFESICNSFTS